MLVNPEIAPNSGNIIRLCANTGNDLHLIEPLGYSLDDRRLKRAGLDYHERTKMTVHSSLEAASERLLGRWLAFSSHASQHHTAISYCEDDVLVFGAEHSGLSKEVLARFEETNMAKIPMMPNNRSLNLGNAVAIIVYEAWRQRDFTGAGGGPVEGSGLTTETLTSDPFDL